MHETLLILLMSIVKKINKHYQFQVKLILKLSLLSKLLEHQELNVAVCSTFKSH